MHFFVEHSNSISDARTRIERSQADLEILFLTVLARSTGQSGTTTNIYIVFQNNRLGNRFLLWGTSVGLLSSKYYEANGIIHTEMLKHIGHEGLTEALERLSLGLIPLELEE